MPLTPGTRLGVYEITAQIGEGGMGQVYRATDTTLGRQVAIKVLPDAFASDPERLARFEREAKTLASLNHPNIAAIYGFEKSDGAHALVMELVEGEDLSQRISRGAIPLDEALPIAKQIAEALEAAHEQGIIHRDLKPANIKVRPDGTVKVLDFGLAKAMDAPSAMSPSVSQAPTITTPAMMTGVGMLLGTAAYMSPEQARGKAVDKRGDVWAFGAVLYEMLAGQRAFEGQDIAEVLGAVIHKEPLWSNLPSTLPLSIRAVITQCLKKDPRQRLRDMGDVRLVLDGTFETAAPSLLQDPAYISRASADLQTQTAISAARGELTTATRRRVISSSLAASLVVGAAVGGASWLATRPAAPRVARVVIATSGATAMVASGVDRDFAITPDGTRIVYRGSNDLLVRALDQIEPTVLGGLGRPQGIFVSPDGQWVGFFDGDRNAPLKKVAMTGGPALLLTETRGLPSGATWAEDGSIIFSTSWDEGLQRVSSAGSKTSPVTTPDRTKGESNHSWPEFLPGGQAALYTITAVAGGLDNAAVAVVDLRSGTSKVLLRGGYDAHYVSTGHLVYGASGTLRAVPFDLERLEVMGASVPVLDAVATTTRGAVAVTVAANGSLVYSSGGLVGQRSLVWLDRQGREEAIAGAPERDYIYPRISPDGARVALDIGGDNRDIWIWEFTRATLTRLTEDPTADRYPLWTPDGQYVIFGSGRTDGEGIYRRAADGSGGVERLTQSATRTPQPISLSPDGTRLVFEEQAVDGGIRLLSLVIDSHRTGQAPATAPAPQVLLQTPFNERNGEVSPDGRWLAYSSEQSGQAEIYVRPFPDVNGSRAQVSIGGGRSPLWARNGQELFYVAPDGALMAVSVERGPTWKAGVPAELFNEPYTWTVPGRAGRSYDISPDGRRFLAFKPTNARDQSPTQENLVVVINWFEELRRLVPVK